MIKDSGNRREFDSGAVRDIQEGKGRCDLLPLDVIGCYYKDGNYHVRDLIFRLAKFVETGDAGFLQDLLCYDINWLFNSYEDMLLEVSIHFEEGAVKYGDNNWRKGIPVRCYIDSAVRHLLKHLRGDTDERHDRAFCWNIMCAIWTCVHIPELNDYKNGGGEDE